MRQNFILTIILLVGCVLTSGNICSQIINDVDFSIKCGTKFHTNNTEKQIDKLQSSYQCTTTSKYFMIHYDTVGVYAVNKTDKDKNEIPDYIDSVCAIFDYVYEVQVIEMGMERPRTDYPGGDENNPYYDIYIVDFAADNDPTYGYTAVVQTYDEAVEFNKAFSCIVIDNDYSPDDTYIKDGQVRKLYNTSGIDGLKVTAAHEFHHAIQFATGIVKGYNNSIYEMTATFTEMLVYPNLYDYVNYVNALMSNLNDFVFGDGQSHNGYPFGIFFYMLKEKLGKNIVKDYYDLTIQVGSCYKGLDSILVLNNSSLHNEWMTFIEWLYHSGKNAIEGKYFPMASRFRTPNPINTLTNYGVDQHFITPYQIVYTRFINLSQDPFVLSDTVELFYTNVNTEDVIEMENNYYPHSIVCNAEASWNEIVDGEKLFDDFWLKVSSPSQYMDYYLVKRAGGKVTKISHCYPMPFNKTTNDYLYFPISDNVVIGKKVKLTIYDGTCAPIFSEMLETSADNQHRVLKFKPDILVGGIYTFTISCDDANGDTDIVGKIVIK